MADLCIQRAVRGSSSQISIPDALVAIGLNSPPTPSGAVGLRSNMSCVGGPPCRYKRTTLFARLGRTVRSAEFSRAKRAGVLKKPPSSESAPAWSASRRVGPLQPRRALPSNVIALIALDLLFERNARSSRLQSRGTIQIEFRGILLEAGRRKRNALSSSNQRLPR